MRQDAMTLLPSGLNHALVAAPLKGPFLSTNKALFFGFSSYKENAVALNHPFLYLKKWSPIFSRSGHINVLWSDVMPIEKSLLLLKRSFPLQVKWAQGMGESP